MVEICHEKFNFLCLEDWLKMEKFQKQNLMRSKLMNRKLINLEENQVFTICCKLPCYQKLSRNCYKTGTF